MKYKTFRNLLLLGAVGSAGVGIVFAVRSGDERTEEPVARTELPPTEAPDSPDRPDPPYVPDPPVDDPPDQPVAAAGQPLRELDRALIEAVARPLAGGKGKDVFPGQSYKVNLYQDSGFDHPNRAKVDLDRDNKWDEKWTWKDGGVVRQVSPADDDKSYTDEYRLVDDRWMTAADLAAPAVTAEEPSSDPSQRAETEPLRAVDRAILELAGKPLAGGKGKDVLGGDIKVNLYQDSGFDHPNRAKLDLDRDDKWDEKWTWKDGGVARQISPTDDDKTYSIDLRLRGDKWVRK